MISPQLTDFHIHPDYSIDAKGSIEDYCLVALRKGLKKICFTTHIDLDPRRVEVDPFMRIDAEIKRIEPEFLQRYYDEIKTVQARFRDEGLEVFTGVEIDYFDGVVDIWNDFNSGLKFDYILGSVHCIDGIAFTWSKQALECYNRFPLPILFQKYYQSVIALAKTNLFDCVGHLDGYRKYAADAVGDAINHPPHELLREALTAIKEAGIGIEINSAALRHKTGTTYPSEDILQLAASMQVPVISLGSDAHQPKGLAAGLDISAGYIEKYGLKWRPRL
ncbi:MAG: histidinol-phosphatase HisJ family protein [candidate division Zixibacteria bacterium]|nr:histidinol-phosphatase HisJ family protein [candidate division Zixibacteria bacterium]